MSNRELQIVTISFRMSGGLAGGAALTSFDDTDTFESELLGGGLTPDLIVLGSDLPSRLRVARRIRAVAQHANVLLICEPEGLEPTRDALLDEVPRDPCVSAVARAEAGAAQILERAKQSRRSREDGAASVRAASRASMASELLGSLAEHAPMGIVVLDAERHIASWNPGATQMIGRPAASVLGQPLSAVLPAEATAALERFSMSRGSASEARFEVGARTFELRFASLSADGGDATLCLMTDVSAAARVERRRESVMRELESEVAERARHLEETNERLRAEIEERLATEQELLLARSAAETAVYAKAGFLSNISHEIRTPMNGVLGMTHLLSTTDLDETQREYVDTISECGSHLLSLLDDVLDFSKLEDGELDLEPTSADIRALLEASVDTVAEAARAKGLELSLHVEDSVAGTLLLDARRLEQIVVNLLSNAVKFTSEGAVSVTASSRPLDRQHTELQIRVQDTGIGIQEDALDHLFEPFIQADLSATRRYGGTGLGLTICRSLATLMGGTVGAHSEVGVGSTFTLVLPAPVVSSRPPSERRERRSASDVARGTRALVVDANEGRRQVLRQMLERWKMVVVETAEPSVALDWTERLAKELDVALIDHDVPGVVDTARKIRLQAPALPILVLASDAKQTQELDSIEDLEVLLKPAHAARLYDAMVRALTPDFAHGPPLSSAPPSEPRTLRILIAEDNSVNRRVLELMLDGLGYPNHRSVANGALAVDALRTESYDLVLMDVQMPEMDGLEATQRIREDLGRSLPIVAVTAHATPEARARVLEVGMDDHIGKPIDRALLAAVLAQFDADLVPTPAIDTATVERLLQAAQGDQRFVHGLAVTFERESAAQLEQLRKALAEDDRAAIGALASTLKSSSGSLGATQVHTLADRLIKEASLAEVDLTPRIEGVAAALSEAWAALNEALS